MVHVNIASIIFFPPENCFALCMCQWCINTLICIIIFEQIICSDFGITMCSVLQSPMPSAPFLRAANASSGVSAFAITWSNDSRYGQSNCSDAYLQNFGKLSLILVWQESMYKMKNVKTTYIYTPAFSMHLWIHWPSCNQQVKVRFLTLKPRHSSTQLMKVPKSPLIAGGASGCLPRTTSPVDPFREIQSPSWRVIPLATRVCTWSTQHCNMNDIFCLFAHSWDMNLHWNE